MRCIFDVLLHAAETADFFSALARTGRREETPHNLSARLVRPTVLHDASRRERLRNAA